jgi:hypothetical protein
MQESRENRRLLRRRMRRWAERLMEDSSLRDNLTDTQAQQLLKWGIRQIEDAARRTLGLPDEAAKQTVEKEGTAVHLIMKGVNDLMGTIGKPLEFDIIDDVMTRLLKNHRWLTNERPSPARLKHVTYFNEERQNENREAAFQHLLSLIDAGER